jgi:hypothetical protein
LNNDLKLLLLALIISSITSSILVYLLTSTYTFEIGCMFNNWVIDISAGSFIFALILIIRERKRKNKGKNMYHWLLQYYFGFAQKFYIHTIKV